MTTETLSYINSVLKDELEIPYAFMEWQDDPPEAYFVGEYSEGDTPRGRWMSGNNIHHRWIHKGPMAQPGEVQAEDRTEY